MRDPKEVRDRIKTLLVLELTRRVETLHRRLPHLCVHNHRQELDPRREIDGIANLGFNRVDREALPVVYTLGLCLLGSDDPQNWPGDTCDEPIDAQRCPAFQPRVTKEALLAEFRAQLGDPTWVKANMPGLENLLWVLDDSPANYPLPWWSRLWYWLLRVRVEPIRPYKVPELKGLLEADHGIPDS